MAVLWCGLVAALVVGAAFVFANVEPAMAHHADTAELIQRLETQASTLDAKAHRKTTRAQRLRVRARHASVRKAGVLRTRASQLSSTARSLARRADALREKATSLEQEHSPGTATIDAAFADDKLSATYISDKGLSHYTVHLCDGDEFKVDMPGGSDETRYTVGPYGSRIVWVNFKAGRDRDGSTIESGVDCDAADDAVTEIDEDTDTPDIGGENDEAGTGNENAGGGNENAGGGNDNAGGGGDHCSPADPDGMENGGADKPATGGEDCNNGSGNDADCEDDNNGNGTPGHCRPDDEVIDPPTDDEAAEEETTTPVEPPDPCLSLDGPVELRHDSWESVRLQSCAGSYIRVWWDPMVTFTFDNVEHTFTIGYGRGDIQLSDGSHVSWDTTDIGHRIAWIQVEKDGKIVKTGPSFNGWGLGRTGMSDRTLRELAEQMYRCEGDPALPLACDAPRHGSVRIDLPDSLPAGYSLRATMQSDMPWYGMTRVVLHPGDVSCSRSVRADRGRDGAFDAGDQFFRAGVQSTAINISHTMTGLITMCAYPEYIMMGDNWPAGDAVRDTTTIASASFNAEIASTNAIIAGTTSSMRVAGRSQGVSWLSVFLDSTGGDCAQDYSSQWGHVGTTYLTSMYPTATGEISSTFRIEADRAGEVTLCIIGAGIPTWQRRIPVVENTSTMVVERPSAILTTLQPMTVRVAGSVPVRSYFSAFLTPGSCSTDAWSMARTTGVVTLRNMVPVDGTYAELLDVTGEVFGELKLCTYLSSGIGYGMGIRRTTSVFQVRDAGADISMTADPTAQWSEYMFHLRGHAAGDRRITVLRPYPNDHCGARSTMTSYTQMYETTVNAGPIAIDAPITTWSTSDDTNYCVIMTSIDGARSEAWFMLRRGLALTDQDMRIDVAVPATVGVGAQGLITVSGARQVQTRTYTYVEPGATSCAPTASQQDARPTSYIVGTETMSSAAMRFSSQHRYVPHSVGRHLVCAYVAARSTDAPVMQASAVFDVMVPVMTLRITAPGNAAVGVSSTVSFASITTAEVNAGLRYALFAHPTDGTCEATAQREMMRVDSVALSRQETRQAFSGQWIPTQAGSWRICGYAVARVTEFEISGEHADAFALAPIAVSSALVNVS